MSDFTIAIIALWLVGACGWMLNDLRRPNLGALAITLAFTAFTWSAAWPSSIASTHALSHRVDKRPPSA